ncbi:MAG: vitamin K epoxide reductase family protein [bacterium]|nr:vitamin K epoxide reductase family protein [bacterium]
MIPSKKLNWILAVFIVAGFIGFLDAAYLTVQHYQQGVLPCYIFEGCDLVTTSKYSAIFGIPVSLFGALYYVFIMLAALFYLDTKNKKALKILKILPVVGLVATIWFLFLQIFIIKAICFYCVVSAVTSTTIFISGLFLKIKSS